MATEKFIFEFNEKGLEQILQKVEAFRAKLGDTGAAELGQGFQRFFNEFSVGVDKSAQRVTLLRDQLAVLKQVMESSASFDPSAQIGTLPPQIRQLLEGVGITDQSSTLRAEAQARTNALVEEQVRLETILANQQQRYNEAKLREANLSELTNRLESNRVNLISQLEGLKPGGSQINELVAQRENNLLERQAELRKQLAEEQKRFRETVPQEGTQILNRELELAAKTASARKQVAAAEKEVAAARRAAVDADLATATRFVGNATEEEKAELIQRQADLRGRVRTALEEEQRAVNALSILELDRLENAKRLAAIEGTGVGATEILSRLQQVNDAIADLVVNSEGVLQDMLGEGFVGEIEEVVRALRSFEGVEILNPEEEQKLAALQVRARELINEFNRIPKEGIPLRLSEDELIASMSILNRLLLGAARDFGRRFTATLQFALSGALLFGAQRLLREFFDAAVEVERTFADIQTSFQFDLVDAGIETGTAAFERALEGVRRQVLQIADDFNALPTEVNAVAFQMVSRFQDVEAAMIATRAQILATRIATIDQAEALRSLTAVAEAYGTTLFSIEDATERQRRQAELYAEALDYATVIQQRFGISVEDTLEGAAGLAELFRSLGFDIEETFAVVATTVRKTGATGQQVTDRLGRAFSQFTSPQVRDEILALANSVDELVLAPADFFDSGKTALLKIIDQYQDLDASVQNRLAQIIGQRRETAFVSALLQGASTGMLDEVVTSLEDSAGAAENRLGILLATVSGTIEGISTEFQTLAQNMERLGLITPIKLLLSGLELVLKTLNGLVSAALNLIEVLNRVRIPFTNMGLGDALAQMLALVTAAASLRALIDGIRLVADARGASGVIDIFRGLLGGETTTKGGGLAGRAGGALGITAFASQLKATDGLAAKVGTTMKTLFLAPFQAAIGLFQVAKVRLGLLQVALTTGTTATVGATVAENGLLLARARTAIATGLLAIRSKLAVDVLFNLGRVFSGLGAALLRIPGYALAAVGAIGAVQGIFSVVTSFVKGLFDEGGAVSTTGVSERAKGFEQEAAAAGETLSATEARIKALEEVLSDLNPELEKAERNMQSMFLQALGVLPINIAESFPGSEHHLAREKARVILDLAFAEVQKLQQDLEAANLILGGTRDNLVAELQPAQDSINDILNELVNFDVDDAQIGSDLLRLDDLNADIESQKGLISQAREMFEEVASIIQEWGEVLTPDQIRQALSQLQVDMTLGRTTLEEAKAELARLRSDALQGLQQAQAFNEVEAAEEYSRALDDIAQRDLQLFEEEFQAKAELLSGISDNRVRLRYHIELLRAQAREAAARFDPGIEAEILKEIAVLETQYAQALLDEAIARAQFDVDRARTFKDRMAAYKRLLTVIRAQIAAQLVMNAVFGGVQGISAADEARLSSIMNAMADERLRYAILVARNSTLANRSALDEIAAIAATVNALRAEIQFMRSRGDDYQEILAKEIELRNALAQQRLAEADRRAAFFRLTAGAGDQIKAAQAGLRAAEDRLATITALGGAESLQGYEAELAVLQARQALVELALRQADLSRRVASDITDSFEQSLLDVHAAQEALARATGDLEKLEAQKTLAEAEARAQREFYDRRLSDLDFLFQTDQLGRSQYISALRALQAGVDRSTRQGEEIWREIEIQIRGLMDSANQAFNIPTEIRMPTLFEVRRALAADALGVNYQDMRVQEINVFVSDDVDVNAVIAALESSFGGSIDLEAARLSSGAAGITIGGFN